MTQPDADAPLPGRSRRLAAIDATRGLIMIIMALDHARDFLHAGSRGIDPTDPLHASTALFATRWVTHLCAPTFIFLAGVAVFLQLARGRRRAELSRFLVARGLWLILIDATLVSFAVTFGQSPIILSVLFAIGAGFVLLAALIWLPPTAVLALGALIIAGHDLLDGVTAKSLGGMVEPFRILFGGPSFHAIGPVKFAISYSLIPWLGVMALGFGAGSLFLADAARRRRVLIFAGLGMITAFLLIRALNLYGDPGPWRALPTATRTALAFLDVNKYPPSLDFVLATLGPVLLILAALDRASGPIVRVLETYGRTPFFYFVIHLYLLHAIGFGVGVAQGFAPTQAAAGVPGMGLGLPATYAAWIAVVAALYPACAWYGALRRRRPDWWWLSYL